MRKFLVATAMVMASASLAHAEGELFLYNWGNYTSPDMIKKFEDKYGVKVTITDFDSNDTAPVSYTHLDVYKRQDHLCLRDP